MRFLATLFRNLSRHGAVERDLDDEVDAHLELLVDDYRAAGMEDAAARRAARLELGGTGQVKDAVRDVRRGIWIEHFWQDLRYALRTFRRSPGSGAYAGDFSRRFERSRGSSRTRTSVHRGGRAGGRAAPTGRRAYLSVLAVPLRPAA